MSDVASARRERRLGVTVRGVVQGVGFRPFAYRTARELGLRGWVRNSPQGVSIEAEGEPAALEEFTRRLVSDAPPLSAVASLERQWIEPRGDTKFTVKRSASRGDIAAHVPPDIAICADCLADIRDPANRRFRYPFTNCTNCGPRYTIIDSLPYDRGGTAMRQFEMCPDCEREYGDPIDRRFHAQPNACPACGPSVELWDGAGAVAGLRDQALREATAAIAAGRIVAVKGLGGFHLMCDATSDAAVRRLREVKRRESKPLAVMYPCVERIEFDCHISEAERRLLLSPAAPIVLLRAKGESAVRRNVAPRLRDIGAMVPYAPLHVLLLEAVGRPVVATSGNLADEPIAIDGAEALDRLRGVAELFLVHDRPIRRPVDDSIAQVVMGEPQVLRRARGYAPLPVALPRPVPPSIAVGGHMKNTVCVGRGREAFLGQHIGDLDTPLARAAHRRTAGELPALLGVKPRIAACDTHPDYASTRTARESGLPPLAVQHHHAHILACAADNGVDGPVLGVAWDGTGHGADGTIWGGEFLAVDAGSRRRIAHLVPFTLPGGAMAVREPRRSALGVLDALALDSDEMEKASEPATVSLAESAGADAVAALRQMLDRRVNCPTTTSAGRLIDAVASILGVRQVCAYEGQAAMELEALAATAHSVEGALPFAIDRANVPWKVDWRPAVAALIEARDDEPPAELAARFHNALADAIVAVAEAFSCPSVVLAGGCFQNRMLTEATVRRLRGSGLAPHWHRDVPPNDGGLAVGQVLATAAAPPS